MQISSKENTNPNNVKSSNSTIIKSKSLITQYESILNQLDVLDSDTNNKQEVEYMIKVPNPKTVSVSGPGLSKGNINAYNYFEIYTPESAGNGWLSIGIQGPYRDSVLENLVTYTGDGIYVVRFKVKTPGLYCISILWAMHEVNNGPFLCEVSI